jgi:hypothetical protein
MLSMYIVYEGTWAQSGPTVTLAVDKTAGAKTSGKNQPMVFMASADGKTLTSEDKAGTGKGMIEFKRDQ